MKYRLSTLFLLLTIAAISCAWYVDHTNRNRREIVGTWAYPTPDNIVFGYSTSLQIRTDGTFTKAQRDRAGSATYDGTYTCQENGLVVFHVDTKSEESFLDSEVNQEPVISSMDAEYHCRCAVDKTGYLLIDDLVQRSGEKIGIEWETYMPAKAE